jgi:hypothetical protein
VTDDEIDDDESREAAETRHAAAILSSLKGLHLKRDGYCAPNTRAAARRSRSRCGPVNAHSIRRTAGGIERVAFAPDGANHCSSVACGF